MTREPYSRREFLKKSSLAGLGAMLASSAVSPLFAFNAGKSNDLPALLGGNSAYNKRWPKWPIWKPETDEKKLLQVIRSGVWSRAGTVDEFERKWAEIVGAKRCLSVANGTNALIAALTQLDIGGGDEVIVPPYTFIATVAAVLMTGAMPVFADVDPETFQIDPKNIEKKITSRTRAILPVHILGLPADMVNIMAIAKKHNLVVVEDACQAWLAEINHKKVGTFGNAGCFSFQNSKNMAIGEGGAIVSDDDDFMDRCCSFQNYGNPYGSVVGAVGAGTIRLGTKLRITEYQAAIGLAQIVRLEEQTETRNEHAAYLRAKIEKIPGIVPYKLYDNVTKAAFHLFPFRYKKEHFNDLPRATFLKALQAEGIPCSSGYATLNNMPYLAHAFQTKNFVKMYPKKMLDIDRYNEANVCPQNDILCNEEAVWFTQNLLLAGKPDLDCIAAAIEKIHAHSDKLKSATA